MLSWMTTAAAILISGYLARPLPLPLCLAACCLLLLYRVIRGRSQLVGLLLAAVMGLTYASFYAEYRLLHLLPYNLEGQDLQVKIDITSQPQQRAGGRPAYRFDARVVSLFDCEATPCPSYLGKLRLNYYGEQALNNGDTVDAIVRLKRPKGYLSKGAFDYGRWLFVSGYSASGYVRHINQHIKSAGGSTLSWRDLEIGSLKERLSDYQNGDVMLALTFGDRSSMSSERWQQLSATGTSHLLAISGMHIGLVAFWGYLLGRLFAGISINSAVAIRLPTITAMCSALIYGAMAGFALPTQRALMMLAVICLAQLSLRKITPWHGLSFALLAVAIIDPLAAHKPGFYLSFAAVCFLFWRFQGFYSYQRENSYLRFSAGLFEAQWLLGLGLLPLLLAWQFPVAPLSMPANLIAIPIIALLVLPLLLLSYVLSVFQFAAAEYGWQLADYVLQGLFLCLDLLQRTVAPVTIATSSVAVLAALIGAVILLRRGLPGKGVALVLMSVLFLRPVNTPPAGHYVLRVLDVGQGLAVLISTRNHHLLFDAGPDFDGGFNTADAVVIPALRQLGVTEIDALVISHNDRDHAGAVTPLLRHITVAKVYRGEAAETALPFSSADSSLCHLQQSWQWDGVDFRFLSPPASISKTGNAASCVLSVGQGSGRSLIPGDISSLEEAVLGQMWQQELNSAVIVAPHHGSKTSSSQVFIAAVSPSLVVYSSGYKHAYGHPAAVVMERYRRAGAASCWHTGSEGSIAVELAPQGIVLLQPWRRGSYFWEQPEEQAKCKN